MSYTEYLEHEARLAAKREKVIASGNPVDREGELHERIIAFCNAQWPRWKFCHARMDKATTEAVGTEDFTIFLPKNITLHFECKKKGGKLSDAQQCWRKELAMLGHEVHVIQSMEDFLGVVNEVLYPISDPCPENDAAQAPHPPA